MSTLQEGSRRPVMYNPDTLTNIDKKIEKTSSSSAAWSLSASFCCSFVSSTPRSPHIRSPLCTLLPSFTLLCALHPRSCLASVLSHRWILSSPRSLMPDSIGHLNPWRTWIVSLSRFRSISRRYTFSLFRSLGLSFLHSFVYVILSSLRFLCNPLFTQGVWLSALHRRLGLTEENFAVHIW